MCTLNMQCVLNWNKEYFSYCIRSLVHHEEFYFMDPPRLSFREVVVVTLHP